MRTVRTNSRSGVDADGTDEGTVRSTRSWTTGKTRVAAADGHHLEPAEKEAAVGRGGTELRFRLAL